MMRVELSPPPRLSAAIMSHPARLQHARQLQSRHPELNLQVIVDPLPDQDGGPLRTARLAWATATPEATHHLVVQDDTVLCPSFLDQLLAAIAARPDHALCLYAEWGGETSYAVRLAALMGSAWAEPLDHYLPTQALVLPADVARQFSTFDGYAGPHDDVAMKLFLASAGVPAAITVPNLAEDARLPSLVGHGFLGERASVCFLDSEWGDLGWSAGRSATPTAVPAFNFAMGMPYSVVMVNWPARVWRRVSRPMLPAGGRSAAAALELGQTTVTRWPALARLAGPKLLFGVWLTAFGLGRAAAGLHSGPGEPSELDQLLDRPAVSRALATMPSGALRFLVDDHRLAVHANELTSLVETGVRQGYQATTIPTHPQEKP